MRSDRIRGFLLLALGVLALSAPFFVGDWILAVLGAVMFASGLVELGRVISTSDRRAQASSYLGGLVAMLAGAVLFHRPTEALTGLLGLLGILLAGSGAWRLITLVRGSDASRLWGTINGALDVVLGLVVWSLRASFPVWALGLLIGLYLLSLAWTLLLSDAPPADETVDDERDAHPDRELGLAPHPEIGRVRTVALHAAEVRAPIDRGWLAMLVAVFFAIHVGRMDAAWTWLGMISPFVAVLGDLFSAVLVSLVLVLPVRLGWRRLTRPIERSAWSERVRRTDAQRPPERAERLIALWLDRRLAFALRMKASRRSLAMTLWRNAELGLPLVALLIAVNPIWGFSWYFNTENWASAFWQEVAARRTDTWREHMVEAVLAREGLDDPAAPGAFEVAPEGGLEGDFSFLVIGDPGEGDASQLSLTERYLELGRRPDVRFLVISSDVIYPDGAMKDYEPNFYLPFKGFTKPIYGLPGNHDWFNALAAFNANFLTADAARAAMRARVAADRGLTSTTDARIEALIAEARRLREAYRVKTGLQRAPFFELRSPGFTLLVVDTGVMRKIDPSQRRWLEAALQRARGDFTMVILGHPLYAGGVYLGAADAEFAALHELLRRHEVAVVMAGDTHDFEYYRETYDAGGTAREMHHVLNGGGGAYLSIGTALDWPATAPTADWAFYPSTGALRAKLAAETPAWKRPIWWWIEFLGAWPAPVEVLSGVFDFNRAPFFQSFVEVRVLRSAGEVRLLLHGVHGPLRWRDLQLGGGLPPGGADLDDEVTWAAPLAPPRGGAPPGR